MPLLSPGHLSGPGVKFRSPRWQVGPLLLSHWGSLLFAQPCNKPFCAAKKKGRKEGKKEERKKARVRGREWGRKGGMKKKEGN